MIFILLQPIVYRQCTRVKNGFRTAKEALLENGMVTMNIL